MKPSYKTILFYVHPHGSGHFQRAKQLIPTLEDAYNVVLCTPCEKMQQALVSQFTAVSCLLLPSKWPEKVPENERSYDSAFEGVSYCNAANERAAAFVQILKEYNVALFISDVSAELTILARASGVPVIMLRHSGDTSGDPTQNFAYECARSLYAPYPQALETPAFRYQGKTRYLGFRANCEQAPNTSEPGVTIISTNPENVVGWLTCIEEHYGPFTVIGCEVSYPEVTCIGYVSDISKYLDTDIVISTAGNNLVSELLHLRKKVIFVPESRPYGEQEAKAHVLAEQGLAVCMDEKTAMVDGIAWEQALNTVSSCRNVPGSWFDSQNQNGFFQLVRSAI